MVYLLHCSTLVLKLGKKREEKLSSKSELFWPHSISDEFHQMSLSGIIEPFQRRSLKVRGKREKCMFFNSNSSWCSAAVPTRYASERDVQILGEPAFPLVQVCSTSFGFKCACDSTLPIDSKCSQ